MRHLRLALLPLLLVACSDQAPTAPMEDGPAFNFTNNPDVGNFKVYRGQGHFLACWTDPDTGLRACHATYPLGGGTEPDCGLQAPDDPIDFQRVVVNEDVMRVIVNMFGDVYITIRDLNVAGECFDASLVAEGWGRIHYNDNDRSGSVVNNTNTWGFRAQGNLLTTGGDPAKYSGHARLSFRADEPVRVLTSQVNLH